MSDSAHGPLDPAATVVEGFFAELAAAAGSSIGSDELAELRAHVTERLSTTSGTAADAREVLAELGSPTMLAAAFAEDGAGPGAGPGRSSALAGRLLGIPYDVRPPSSERYASRLWDPRNPRIVVPRLFGMGWTVNFGAIAVKARLVRPDDEDDAFASVPERAVTATLAAPIAVVLALAVLASAAWSGLPSTVPIHWGLGGRPDGYGSRGSAVLLVAALAVVPLVFAAAVHCRRRRAVDRVAASALSLGLAVVSLAVLGQTLWTVDGRPGLWPTWVGIGGFVVLPLLLLVGISRLGRAAEQRHDLSTTPKGTAR